MAKSVKKSKSKTGNAGKQSRSSSVAEGPAVKLAVTHQGLLAEVVKLARFVRSAEAILHSSIPSSERADLTNLIADLDQAVQTVQKIRCPDPMYSVITVDKDRLSQLDK
jgi:hypothetical protein